MKHEETYVTLEQARALKRLGFDWECNGYYNRKRTDSDEMRLRVYLESDNHNERSEPNHEVCSAPPLHVAAKWLREVKGLAVNVAAHDGGLYDWDIVFLPNAAETDGSRGILKWFKVYEAALSDGITAALENSEGV